MKKTGVFSAMVLMGAIAAVSGGDLPPVDGLLPDTGGSGIPTVEVPDSVPGGAIAAILLLPPDYSDGVLSVSGRNGSPDPETWTIIARANQDVTTLKQFVVRGGQLVSESISMNPVEALKGSDYISRESLQIDSGQAWQIASAALAAKGGTLSAADYALSTGGKHVAPVWTLTLTGAQGRTAGKMQILATDGSVLSGP